MMNCNTKDQNREIDKMMSKEEIEFQKAYKNTLAGQAEECGKRVKELNKEILKTPRGEGKMIKKFIENMARRGWVSRIRSARETIRCAFEVDENFKQAYVANIATLFYDRYGRGNYITNHKKRNQAAKDILELLFND